MDKFWEWIASNKYGYKILDDVQIYGIKENTWSKAIPTKQMLIGYMMEYLDSFRKENFSFYLDPLFGVQINKSTEERYNWLKSKIEEIDK